MHRGRKFIAIVARYRCYGWQRPHVEACPRPSPPLPPLAAAVSVPELLYMLQERLVRFSAVKSGAPPGAIAYPVMHIHTTVLYRLTGNGIRSSLPGWFLLAGP